MSHFPFFSATSLRVTRVFALASAFALPLSVSTSLDAEAPALAPKSNSALRDGLSAEQFAEAGLHKLTPEELSALERLVEPKRNNTAPIDRPAAAAPSPALPQGDAAFGKEAELLRAVEVQQKVPDELRSRIPGKFTGWTGKTTFVLENGQVWRQTDGGSFYAPLQDPVVTIHKGTLGTFFLRVEGYNSRTKVVRVK